MVKKKSFWLTLLAVLTAAVLVFSACGLAACSSESDDGATVTSVALDNSTLSLTVGGSAGSLKATVTMSDSSDYTGNYTWSSSDETVAKVTGNGASATVTAVAEGSATITVAVSDSKSASCTVTVLTGSTNTDTEDGTIVFEGVWGMNGEEAVAVVTLNPDGTGSQASYDEDGNLDTTNAGTISWSYTDESKTAIDATTSYYGGLYSVPTPMDLAYVDGKLVAANYYMDYGIVSSTYYYLYEQSVTAALESKTNVGSSHAQLVLYDDSCTVVIDDEVSYGTWEWTSDKSGVSVTVNGSSSTYETTSAEVKMNDSIMSATFGTFGTASDVSFLHICDPDLLDTALYRLVSSEGYTLVLDQDGTYETTVGSNTYTGTYTRQYTLVDDTDKTVTYTPTSTSDDEGNFQLTFATYYDDKTDVVFILEENVTSREDSSNYQTYYNSEEHGTAIAVLTGKAYLKEDDSQYGDDEYWLFLYKDGAFSAHVSDASTTNKSDGTWTWSYGAESEYDSLVPEFYRISGTGNETTYASYDETLETWSVTINSRMTNYGNYPEMSMGIYYVYTFTTDEMPAGAFESTTTDGVYLILNGDGTMTANLGYSMGSSTGVWSKSAEGKMEFYKTDSNNNYAISAICTVTDNSDGTISVEIAPRYGTAQTYVIDPDIVPVGGHVYTEEELAQIAELEKPAANVVATLHSDGFSITTGMDASDVTLYLYDDDTALISLTMFSIPMSVSDCSYTITEGSISISFSISGISGTGTGTVTYGGDSSIASITFTEFFGTTQEVVFTAVTT